LREVDWPSLAGDSTARAIQFGVERSMAYLIRSGVEGRERVIGIALRGLRLGERDF
jgi:hypothetical protein